jgi:OOP family OmpA-OmpF porin
MKKSFVLVLFLSFFVVSCGCFIKAPATAQKTCYPKVTILKGVNFDTDKSTLRSESYPILDENAALLKSRPKMTVTIVGHTDSVGEAAYNQKLSEARANTVMKYFAEKGIAADRMKAIGKGETTPIADNKTEAGKAQNRRIEIEFTDPEPEAICK